MEFGTLVERYYFDRYVLEVAIATLEKGGVTSKVDTYQFLTDADAWGLPKYPDKTIILLPDANLPAEITRFIQRNEAYLKEPDSWLGTWIDPGTHHCYLDITTVYSCLEDAKRQALALSKRGPRKIVALYDFKREQTVYL